MSIQVKIPGKLILLGEYAVLEGARALVMAVDRYVKVSVQEREAATDYQIKTNLNHTLYHFMIDESGMIQPHSSETDVTRNEMNFACQAIQAICRQILGRGGTISPFSIEIDTRQFYFNESQKLGLGSSASVIVAIILALAKFYHVDEDLFVNEGDLFGFCQKIHKIAQGNRGSGIDVASSVFGGIVEYLMPKANHDMSAKFRVYTSMPLGLFMVPIWTGVSSSTRNLLKKVDVFRSENPVEFELIMEKMTNLSNNGCRAFKNSDVNTFLNIVYEFYHVLLKFTQRSGVPVISEIHKNIADIVYDAGGIYKPSGAGEGDLGIAFCDSLDKLYFIKDSLSKNQIHTLDLEISTSGIL